MGTKSPVYAPISEAMLPDIAAALNLEYPFVRRCYDILTDGLTTETLLFVALMKQVQRFHEWQLQKESRVLSPTVQTPIERFGPTIKLSAIRRSTTSEGRVLPPGKMQTDTMVLLHDVMVELQMAQGNFQALQSFLREYGMMFVHYHSCGNSAICVKDEHAFYQACKKEQLIRTTLDWMGDHEKDVPLNRILGEAYYTEEDAQVANECFTLAFQLVQKFPWQQSESIEHVREATVLVL